MRGRPLARGRPQAGALDRRARGFRARRPAPAARRLTALVLAAVALAVAADAGCARRRAAASPDAPPARIVSLSPSTTETLFAIGAGGRVVGRSRYCDFPPEATRLPSVGGWVDASLEAILGLGPDLVVGARGPAGPSIAERIEARGVPVLFPPTDSIDDVDRMVLAIGDRVGARPAALELVDRMRSRRAAIAAAVAGRPRPRVLLVFGLRPIVVAGAPSFADDMVRAAGGANAAASGRGYPTMPIEHVMTLDPDVVLDAAAQERRGGAAAGPPGARPAAEISAEPGWRDLRAVRGGRAFALGGEEILRPGPRVGEGVAAIARVLHPDAPIPPASEPAREKTP